MKERSQLAGIRCRCSMLHPSSCSICLRFCTYGSMSYVNGGETFDTSYHNLRYEAHSLACCWPQARGQNPPPEAEPRGLPCVLCSVFCARWRTYLRGLAARCHQQICKARLNLTGLSLLADAALGAPLVGRHPQPELRHVRCCGAGGTCCRRGGSRPAARQCPATTPSARAPGAEMSYVTSANLIESRAELHNALSAVQLAALLLCL